MDAQIILKNGYGFAEFPSVKIYSEYNQKQEAEWTHLKNLLFGDYLKVFVENGDFIEREVKNKTYIKVRGRNATGFILKSMIRHDRILEVNFVDVGQGDGCHLVTPGDEHYVIDAGGSDNMFRFLKWRFNTKFSSHAPPSLKAVISHPDSDHYLGFSPLFGPQKAEGQPFTFSHVYHSGLVQREAEAALGEEIVQGNTTFIKGLVITNDQMKSHLNNVSEGSLHERTLKKSLAQNSSILYSALLKADKAKPVYLLNSDQLQIEVLAPFTEDVLDSQTLRYFKAKNSETTDNVGRTKNGHSVVLKLTIGNVRVLLGGDLNPPAEDYLLQRYTDVDIKALRTNIIAETDLTKKKAFQDQLTAALELAKPFFEVDFAKSCHHGSADFTSEFLRVLNPLATVISSGDDEPHCHPRPDTLGTIGKFSRGERSFIFSTELMRSSKEFVTYKDLDPEKAKERVVTVYGMINLRTDGEKVIIAQKLERPRGKQTWDIHQFHYNPTTKAIEAIIVEDE